uniref:Beta-defensin-like domain-containing protein n=1 Tax=Anas zonorhyncha TaxID=75864 RepID=A0A8B9VDL2_9AVES
MKILFLLLSFFLLFLQGDAVGNSWLCVRRGGNCRFGRCQFAERQIGRCSAFQPCCGHGVDVLNAVSRMSPSLLTPGNSC